LRGAEQAVLCRFFSGTQHFPDTFQAHSLVVSHFKHHPFTRCQFTEYRLYTLANLLAQHVPLRIAMPTLLRHDRHAIHFAFCDGEVRRLLFADLPLSQMVQAEVRNDAIKPGLEAAIEAEMI